MTYAELVTLLETTGYRVAGPTVSDVALPVITVEPLGIEMFENLPLAMETALVTARTVLGEGDLGNWEEVQTMTYAILRTFMGTKVGFDPDIPMSSNTATSPATITSTFSVSFPGESICT